MVARRDMELVDGGMIAGKGDEGRLYDHVLLSPYALTRLDVIRSYRLTGPNIRRDYAAHIGINVEGQVDMAAASSWYHEKYLDRGLAEGWLAEVDGYIVAATPPLGHVPMTSVGPVTSRIEVSGEPEEYALSARRHLHHTVDQEKAALKFLRRRDNPSRATPVKGAQRKALAQSIERIGQVAPIIRWPGMKDGDEVIIDGQTRLDICTELGITPWIIDIDRATPATEVLMRRIESEIQRKPSMTADEKRAYIDTLLRVGGFTYDEIAERVSVSRITVARVASHRQSTNDTLSMKTDDGTERVLKGYQAGIVAALMDGKPLTPKELAAAVAGGTAINVLGTAPKVLEEEGIIARVPGAGPRLFSYVLTERGRTIMPVAEDDTPPPPPPSRPKAKRKPPKETTDKGDLTDESTPDAEHVHTPVTETHCSGCGEVLS